MKIITVNYSLTAEELCEHELYNVYHVKKRKKGIINFKIISGMILLVLIIGIYLAMPENSRLFIIIVSAGIMLGNIFMPAKMFVNEKNIKKHFEENKNMFENVTLTIKDEGLENKSPVSTGMLNYSAIQKIICYNNATYVYISEDNALLISISAFKNNDEKRVF